MPHQAITTQGVLSQSRLGAAGSRNQENRGAGRGLDGKGESMCGHQLVANLRETFKIMASPYMILSVWLSLTKKT